MHEFLHTNPILHAIYHSIILLPLLYLAYLLMEFIEHKTGDRFKHALQEDRRTGPVVGAACGLIPLCGFSDLGAGLYTGRVISVGTLIALFMSTSGETLFLVASHPDKILSLVFLFLIKFVVACLCGFIIDLCLRNKQADIHIHDICEEDHCHCERMNIWISALTHVLPVFSLVLSFNLLIGILELFGLVEVLTFIIESVPALGVLFAAIAGFIPGCAPLVMLFSLWSSGIISSAAFFAGLITSAGTGYIVLYKTNKPCKQNLLITLVIFITSLAIGSIFEFTNLFEILGV